MIPAQQRHLGVEVDVVDDDGVGPGEVEALPPRPRREHEGKDAPVRVVELVAELEALLDLGAAVEAQVPEPHALQEAPEEVQARGPLAEDQGPGPRGLELQEDPLQRRKLCARDELLGLEAVGAEQGAVLGCQEVQVEV